MKLAIIPARGGSKRIPRKNILPFHGLPMIGHTLKTLQATKLFDCIHVSTDDQEIADTVKNLGFSIDFMRPAELSDDFSPVLDVARFVIKKYQEKGQNFESFCMMMPCSPLITSEDISNAYQLYDKYAGKHAVLSVCPFPTPVEWAMTTDAQNILRPLTPELMSKRSQDLKPSYFDTGNFSIQNAKTVLNGDQKVGTEFIPYQLPITRSIDIDSMEDFKTAELLYQLLKIK